VEAAANLLVEENVADWVENKRIERERKFADTTKRFGAYSS